MRKLLILMMMLSISIVAFAQNRINPDTCVVTHHTTTVKGVTFNYTATIGYQPVWDKEGKVVAGVNYTYYERDGVKDKTHRPLMISFNGGPGAGAVWMEIGYTGPTLLNMDEEGNPVQPYGVSKNPYSILDVADIVYVCPVTTGFSRAMKDVDTKQFYGINEDIDYLSDWINTFVTRQNRWLSPKYLIGESYGTPRVSGLSYALQSKHWMFLNGVILVSPTELGIRRDGPVAEALTLPYMCATAWYHKALSADLQNKDLLEILPEVEKWTIEEYIPALSWGGHLSAEKRAAIAKKVSYYSGISEQDIIEHNLTIKVRHYWKELLRDRDFTIGRLDSRYRGRDIVSGGETPEWNAEMEAWCNAFTPPYNWYVRNELNFVTDVKYNMLASVYPWNRQNEHTGTDLMKAISQNPGLKVLLQSGYYDGACDYFNAKYNFWQMDKGGKFQDRFTIKGYRCGHMMYVRKEDMKQANEDIREFIKASMPVDGKGIAY